MINTKCQKCFFAEYEQDVQTGCKKNRLDIWKSKNLSEFDGTSYTINTVCNAYCETKEHADLIDEIIMPTCDFIIYSTDQDNINNIVNMCKDISRMEEKPSSVYIAIESKVIKFKDLYDSIKNILDIPFSIMHWRSEQNIDNMIDESIRKCSQMKKKESRYVFTIRSGESVPNNLIKRLNKVENLLLDPILAAYNDASDPYNCTLITRAAYNFVGKNLESPALLKLLQQAEAEEKTHLVKKWTEIPE